MNRRFMMIDQCISVSVVPLQSNVNYKSIYNRGIRTSSSSSSNVVLSSKDLVEKKATKLNKLFLPMPNKTFQGKQIYQFGHGNICIEKNVIFLYENNNWPPIRLSELLKIM